MTLIVNQDHSIIINSIVRPKSWRKSFHIILSLQNCMYLKLNTYLFYWKFAEMHFIMFFYLAGRGIVHVKSNCMIDGIWHAIARSNDFTSSYYMCEDRGWEAIAKIFLVFQDNSNSLHIATQSKTLIRACKYVSNLYFSSLFLRLHIDIFQSHISIWYLLSARM